jgi:hypothetical protein
MGAEEKFWLLLHGSDLCMIWEEKFWNSSVEGEKVAEIVFTRGLFPWIVVCWFEFFFLAQHRASGGLDISVKWKARVCRFSQKKREIQMFEFSSTSSKPTWQPKLKMV